MVVGDSPTNPQAARFPASPHQPRRNNGGVNNNKNNGNANNNNNNTSYYQNRLRMHGGTVAPRRFRRQRGFLQQQQQSAQQYQNRGIVNITNIQQLLQSESSSSSGSGSLGLLGGDGSGNWIMRNVWPFSRRFHAVFQVNNDDTTITETPPITPTSSCSSAFPGHHSSSTPTTPTEPGKNNPARPIITRGFRNNTFLDSLGLSTDSNRTASNGGHTNLNAHLSDIVESEVPSSSVSPTVVLNSGHRRESNLPVLPPLTIATSTSSTSNNKNNPILLLNQQTAALKQQQPEEEKDFSPSLGGRKTPSFSKIPRFPKYRTHPRVRATTAAAVSFPPFSEDNDRNPPLPIGSSQTTTTAADMYPSSYFRSKSGENFPPPNDTIRSTYSTTPTIIMDDYGGTINTATNSPEHGSNLNPSCSCSSNRNPCPCSRHNNYGTINNDGSGNPCSCSSSRNPCSCSSSRNPCPCLCRHNDYGTMMNNNDDDRGRNPCSHTDYGVHQGHQSRRAMDYCTFLAAPQQQQQQRQMNPNEPLHHHRQPGPDLLMEPPGTANSDYIPHGSFSHQNSLRNIFNNFTSYTTLHGLPNANTSPTYKGKIFWGIIFAVCFLLSVLQLRILVAKYFSYEKNIELNSDAYEAAIQRLQEEKAAALAEVDEEDKEAQEKAENSKLFNQKTRRKRQGPQAEDPMKHANSFQSHESLGQETIIQQRQSGFFSALNDTELAAIVWDSPFRLDEIEQELRGHRSESELQNRRLVRARCHYGRQKRFFLPRNQYLLKLEFKKSLPSTSSAADEDDVDESPEYFKDHSSVTDCICVQDDFRRLSFCSPPVGWERRHCPNPRCHYNNYCGEMTTNKEPQNDKSKEPRQCYCNRLYGLCYGPRSLLHQNWTTLTTAETFSLNSELNRSSETKEAEADHRESSGQRLVPISDIISDSPPFDSEALERILVRHKRGHRASTIVEKVCYHGKNNKFFFPEEQYQRKQKMMNTTKKKKKKAKLAKYLHEHSLKTSCLCVNDEYNFNSYCAPHRFWINMACHAENCLEDNYCGQFKLSFRINRAREHPAEFKACVCNLLADGCYGHGAIENSTFEWAVKTKEEAGTKSSNNLNQTDGIYSHMNGTNGSYLTDLKVDYSFVFENLTDEMAIQAIAKETLLYIGGELTMEERVNMSYEKSTLISMCSYNGEACDMDEDFRLRVDPFYGNCYTYNWNPKAYKNSTRAGAIYGLRVMVQARLDDYLFTTDSAGVRLAIHDRRQEPFPEVFGQSAPNGFMSSFGVKLEKMNHLPSPYGDCTHEISEDYRKEYIFDEDYSVEGCYRSCYQHKVLRMCKCGDPRFPVPPKRSTCGSDKPYQRQCIERAAEQMGNFNKVTGCYCPKPCLEYVFSATYSGSIWPARNTKETDSACGGKKNKTCIAEFKKNSAVIEVFYERLNYQALSEIPAYGVRVYNQQRILFDDDMNLSGFPYAQSFL